MAIAPKYAALKFAAGDASKAQHTVELFLDYVCPFSKKMFDTLYDGVFSEVEKKYPSKVAFVFRPQIQPWHPSSTLTHEAALAVIHLKPEAFYPFSKALFAQQTDFYDISVVNETRNQTYRRLAMIGGAVGVDENAMYKLLEIPDKSTDGSLNVGNGVTNDIKYLVKTNRLLGMHVTPTVLFDGVEERSISSSFSKEQWGEWLSKNVV